MNDTDFPVALVLEGIEAAAAAGLTPVKINAVVQGGVNDHTLVELARHFKGSGHILRFVEYMDVGATNGWRLDEVVAAEEVVRRIDAALPLAPLEPNYDGEVAKRWAYADGEGGDRASSPRSRVRSAGTARAPACPPTAGSTPRLFAVGGLDLRGPMRAGASDGELEHMLRGLSGSVGRIATPTCALRRPPSCRVSRCPTSAADGEPVSDEQGRDALTHLDAEGRARMVDVSEKAVTVREATARGRVAMQPQTLRLIVEGRVPKGDVLAVARVAGIMAAKRTSELIPLCPSASAERR